MSFCLKPVSAIESGCEGLFASLFKITDIFEQLSPNSSLFQDDLRQEVHNVADLCKSIRSICKLMQKVINRFIDFAKVSNGFELVPNISLFDLKACVASCVDVMSDLQQRVPITVVNKVTDDDSQSIYCLSDRQWFFENLLCLVSNAIKFASNDVAVTITLSLQNSMLHTDSTDTSSPHSPSLSVTSYLIIEVEDNGPGVPEDRKKEIFNVPKLSKQSTGGAGLGLFTLMKRIKALGGKCGMHNRLNNEHGSVFWFSFPFFSHPQVVKTDVGSIKMQCSYEKIAQSPHCSPLSSKRLQISPVAATLTTTDSGSMNLKVLIVDDSLPILKMTRKMLEREGITTNEAMNGQEALKHLSKQNYDIVLMDIQMPVMDGIKTALTIREQERDKIEDLSKIKKGTTGVRDRADTLTDSRMRHVPSNDSNMGEDHVPDELPLGIVSEDFTTNSNATMSYDHIDRDNLPEYYKHHRLAGEQSKDTVNKRLFIIGCSANADDITKRDALNAGMDYFIQKPVTFQKLLDALAECMIKPNKE